MIALERLSKSFGSTVALADVTLTVPRGSCCALLGHNGAGKSTALGCMLGLLRPSAGAVRLDGVSVAADRTRALARVGAVLDPAALYPYLTGFENLALFASYSGGAPHERLREVGALVGLAAALDRRVAVYSRGMRQRLAVAQALVPAPAILLLDEPAGGLDPDGTAEVYALLADLARARELTVLLASHDLAEVEATCDRVAILRAGRLVAAGVLADVTAGGRRLADVYRDTAPSRAS